jgi:hypothetical protein
VSSLFVVAFFVLLYGVFRPYRGLKRWHFGAAAFVAFILIGVFAPEEDREGQNELKARDGSGVPSGMSKQQMAQLEKKNASQIALLQKQVAVLPASQVEENLRIYKQMSMLAPLNADYSKRVREYEAKLAARGRYEDHPEEALLVKDFNWQAGGFGSVMEITSLTIRNDAPFAIKDFKLHCVHSGNSGTQIDENTRVQFEIVPANSERTFRNINMGFISSQVASSSCEITDAAKA